MKVDFNKMPDHARIWIYQANRRLKETEVAFINDKLNAFIPNWQSHGEEVKVGHTVLHNQFVILGIDENYRGASGCSIDSSVAQIKEIDAALNVDLLDKLNITYKKGEQMITADLATFKKSIKNGGVDKETVIFNNTIQSYGALLNEWEIPLEKSWLAKYFQKEPLI